MNSKPQIPAKRRRIITTLRRGTIKKMSVSLIESQRSDARNHRNQYGLLLYAVIIGLTRLQKEDSFGRCFYTEKSQ